MAKKKNPKPKLYKFQFTARGGTHSTEDGTIYRRGDLIYSPLPLATMFKERFTPVPMHAPLPLATKDTAQVEGNKARAAQHGDTVPDPAPEAVVANVPNEVPTDGRTGDDTADYGEEVTANFGDAAAAGVQVFKDGRVYTVVSTEDPSTPLNLEPLSSKARVVAFIDDLVDADDAEAEG